MGEVDLVVDGGGSTTRVGVASAGRVLFMAEGPSANHYSVGTTSAVRHLSTALRQAASMRPEGTTIRTACLAMSGILDDASLDEFSRAAQRSAAGVPGLSGVEWIITNDVAPLLLDQAGELVVVVCGTGTSFVARGPDGTVARASGREYLLSDEGGGFDIGLRGMRAVVRAADGRGPPTNLTAAALQWVGSVDGLAAAVNGRDDVKAFVASFAAQVLEAATAGDEVALAIVHDAAVELAVGIGAVADRAHLSTPLRVRTNGSLLVGGHEVLRTALGHVVEEAVELAPISRTTLELVSMFADAVRAGSRDVAGVIQAFPFSRRAGSS
ncbi:MAG: BadF/BadG/BcrA/BcrD ATPase family protein [Actinomycetota bacterium]